MTRSLGSYKIRGLVELLQLCRTKTNNALANNAVFASSRPILGDQNGTPNVQLAGARYVHDAAAAATSGGVGGNGKPTPPPKPPTPTPRRPRAGSRLPWLKMMLGSVFSLLLAFWAPKWTTILRIGGEAEVVLKEVEQAAEVVEKVATVVEKVSQEVADNLPSDNKIKEAALVVEHFSEEAAKDAHIAEEIIHKVEMLKQDLEDVRQSVEPLIETTVHNQKSDGSVNSNL